MKKVMVTGGTGYIGSWVVKYLLEEGLTVHTTVRDKNKKDKVQHLVQMANDLPGKLIFFEADLLKEGSFNKAMDGCDTVFHLASPFVINNIKDPYAQLIDPAVKGTTNVLETANQTPSVQKVVLTSSIVAIVGDHAEMHEKKLDILTEAEWNTTSSASHQPYPYSKVLAEKEAWKIHDAQNRWKLVVINPGFVMGPSLTKTSDSASLSFMRDLLSGKMATGAPDLTFAFVDVRDVAKAHVLAAQNPKAGGRHITVNQSKTMLEYAAIIKSKFGKKYKLPTMQTPKFMLYLVGWAFGLTWKFISRNVGHPLEFDNSKSKELLGLEYLPLEQTVEDMVAQMEAQH